MTLPSHAAALPLRYNDRQSPTGVYQDVPEPVLSPFGHGLRYRHCDVSAVDTVVDADQVRILVTLVSHSDAPTRGTVAAFGHRRGGTRAPRSRELLAFARVHLRPGEQQRLELLCPAGRFFADPADRSEEHTSESSHVATSYAVFCLKNNKRVKELKQELEGLDEDLARQIA